MHIPQEMLTGPICPVTATVAGITLAAAAGWAFTHRTEPIVQSLKKFIGVTAIIFVLQALNFPIWHGISGHFIGGVLAAAILGIPLGMISMATVLSIQAVFFGDGGIDALGANILNMGIIGAGVGGLIRLGLNKIGTNNLVSTANAAFFGLILAVLALDAELIICGKGSVEVYENLMFAHLPLAIAESFIAAALYALLTQDVRQPSLNFSLVSAVIVVVIGLVLLKYPGASSLPDGLEWTEEKCQLTATDANSDDAQSAETPQVEATQKL